MAISEKDFETLSNNVSELRRSLSQSKAAARRLFLALLLISLAALGWSIHVGNKVNAIEDDLSNNWRRSVAQLASPKSPAQLQAAVTSLRAQIETAKAQGTPPDQEKAAAYSRALSRALKANPTLPGAWNTAIQMVDYRFAPETQSVASLPNCLNTPLNQAANAASSQQPQPIPAAPASGVGEGVHPQQQGETLTVQNCRLALDDANFGSSNAAKILANAASRDPKAGYSVLEMSNAYITYSGGALIPIREIHFRICSFNIEPTIEALDERQQSIVSQLLEAEETNGTLQLSDVK
ncbi:MAG TPA: hypothetical protein VK716_07800 [Terracidiphilus sp.]|jgi:hypothetical protein|nr:hypothetical protein [Terracidiphilus sp.]